MKEFGTAVKRTENSEPKNRGEAIPFMFYGIEVKVYQPDPGQYAMLMASVGRGASEMDRIGGVINFFMKIMDDDSASYIESCLLDSGHPMGIDDIEDVVQWLNEEWSGKVTESPSASTQSPSPAGPNSTQHSLLST